MTEKQEVGSGIPDSSGAGEPGEGVTAAAPKRTKLSAEDMEAKFAARRAERHARTAGRPPGELNKLVRGGVAAMLGVGLIGMALGMSGAASSHEAAVAANESKIVSLQDAVASLAPEAGGETSEALASGLEETLKRSDELAAAQQQFAVIAHAGNDEPGTGDGRPKDSALKALDHRKALAAFFAPQALTLSDAEAYSFRTENLLGPGDMDPRLPWYMRYEATGDQGSNQKVADPAGYSWRTASVDLSGTPGVMTVVWTNTDSQSGDLLAWTTARYDTESSTFSSFSFYKTTRGESQQLQVGTAGDETQGVDA